MNPKEFDRIDNLFDAARKVPIKVELSQVKEHIHEAQRVDLTSGKGGHYGNISPWQLSLAAGLALILGLAAWFISTSPTPGSLRGTTLVALDTTPSHGFTLIDTYKGEPLSYWDTSSIQHEFSSISFQNIHCIQTYLADTACHISIALELGKPDLVNFFLADMTGKIIRDLLIDERQYQADSSYNFDLCQLQAGRYELVVNTNQGDYIRKPIFLN